MTTDAIWIRRSFMSAGLTQIPTGLYLKTVQHRFGGGTVMLMLDVSGSMCGPPLTEAVRGARTFVGEAVEAGYEVGVVLWHTEVVASCTPTPDGAQALVVLNQAIGGGGNNLIGPLIHCHAVLNQFTGDRVVCLFGDGDLTPKDQVLEKVAQMKSENIRFVTRGLGEFAGLEFGEISDEQPGAAKVDGVEDLAEGIASMATALRV
jgi:Mg-chelatase subunit ChlD